MAGNIPNVSRNNFRYANLLTGGLSTIYDGVPLQQGVPITDSDVNEMQDYQRMSRILDNIAMMGVGFTRFGLSANDTGGFLLQESAPTTNNFTVGAGYAALAGVVVPSTTDILPTSFDYDEQIVYSGALTGVVGAGLQDTGKLFSAADSLTASVTTPIHGACFVVIVNSANPTEIGHAANIASYTATELTINTVTPPTGYTVINPANLAAGDTYVVMLPLLTTPAGDRTDEVYLQVWFDDINENEDTNIVNTSIPVEAVHKTAKRWLVRVSEGGVAPTTTLSNAFGFGVRYTTFGHLHRINATAGIAAAQIENLYDCCTGLSSINPQTVSFDYTNLTAGGFIPTPAVADRDIQHAVDLVISTLASSSAGKGSTLIGSPGVTGTVETLSAGTLLSQLSAILGHLDNRIEAVNPSATVTAPIPIFRSHGLALTATTTITEHVVTIYLVPASPGSTQDGLAICTGCYLSGTDAKTGSTHGSGNATILFLNGYKTTLATKATPGNSATWTYSDYGSWSSTMDYDHSQGFSANTPNFWIMGPTTLESDVILYGPNSHIVRNITSATVPSLMMDGVSVSANIGYPSMYVVNGKTSTTAENGGWWFTQNCTYEAGNVWVQTNASKPSSALNIATEGFVLYRKALGATNWGLTGWDSKFVIGGQADDKSGGASDFFYQGQSVDNVFERVHYSTVFQVHRTATQAYVIQLPINYRSRRSSTPTASITLSIGEVFAATKVFTEVDNWGGYLTITLEAVSYTAGVEMEFTGYIDFY